MKGAWPVLIFAMIWPTLATSVYFVALANPTEAAVGPNHGLQGFYFASKALQFSLPVLWLGLWCGQALWPQRPTLRGLHVGVAFSVLVVLAMLTIYFSGLRGTAPMQQAALEVRAKVHDFGMASPPLFLVMALAIALPHSLLEEYYFRWFIFGELRKRVAVPLAIIISGFAFMGHHVVVLGVYFSGSLSLALVLALGVAIGGMFWAWLYHQTGSLGSAWISHLLIDLGIMFVGYDLLFG